MKRSYLLGCVTLASVLMASSGLAAPTPLSAEFTYQGSLNTTGGAYTGLADLRFRLYDQPGAGGQVGATLLVKSVFVDRGLFTVPLDFGVAAFNGENRWMEIDVRTPAGVGGFTTLSGRQKVTATPYALQTRGLFTDALLNVGVGTTTPQARLNVNGVLRIDDGEFEIFNAGALRLYTANAASAIVTNSTGSALFVAGMGSSIDRSGFIELRTPSGFLTAILEGDADNGDNGVQTGLLRLGSEGIGAGGGVISVTNNDGRETFNLVGGGSGLASTLKLFGATGTSATVRAEGSGFGSPGGGLYTSNTSGSLQWGAEPDIDGSGGFMYLARTVGAAGMTVDGNFAGTESAVLSLFGTASSMSFNTSVTGDSSVALPANSISAAETLDEPGVANVRADFVAISSSTSALVSRSITVPGPGYIVAFAQGDLEIVHAAGTVSNVVYGVSQTATAIPGDLDVQTQLPGAASAGRYDFSASSHGLFTVAAAGTYTYYFNAYRFQGASANMFDMQLTLMYFPTNYGTVVSNLTSPGGSMHAVNHVGENALMPMTSDDIVAERDAEFARHSASVNTELGQMRQQMAQMQARMNQIAAQQATMRSKESKAPATKAPLLPNIASPASAMNPK